MTGLPWYGWLLLILHWGFSVAVAIQSILKHIKERKDEKRPEDKELKK